MAEIESNISRLDVADALKAGVSFLICGLLSGLFFSWLTTHQSLSQFWYFKTDKFLIPRYTYWAAFGLICLFSLTVGYAISRSRKWLHAKSNCSASQFVLAGVIVVTAAPILCLAGSMMNPLLGMAAPIIFLILYSLALCIFTQNLRLLVITFLWNLVFATLGLGLVYGVMGLINVAGEWSDFVQWPILVGMLALSCGSWLGWRERVENQRTV